MKDTNLPAACFAALLITQANAATVFEADFEASTAANTGSIVYTSTSEALSALNNAPNAKHGNNVLYADPTDNGGVATDFRLNPTTAASLTGGDTAIVSLDVAWRRTSGATKSHFVTGYDSSDVIIFQFVLADANEFANTSGNDRQQPGYATSADGSLGFLAGDIATGTNPGTFYWGSDSSPATFVGNSAHFDITVGADGWSVAGQGAFAGPFTTNTLATYNGATHTDLAYVEITGESTAAGAYFDNFTIVTVPEPSSTALLGLGGLALILRRRK